MNEIIEKLTVIEQDLDSIRREIANSTEDAADYLWDAENNVSDAIAALED